LQDCMDNIYELFSEELADAKHELNTADFENFCKLLYDVSSSKEQSITESLYIESLKLDLYNRYTATFG
ncbi:3273_t:CDS:2, partial [Racocetra fulgida]